MKPELLTLADYHAWAFAVLYDALLPLSDEQYRADCGLFFRSIHRTLNHLLVADHVWFGRFAGAPFAVDRKSTRLNSSHIQKSRMPSSA